MEIIKSKNNIIQYFNIDNILSKAIIISTCLFIYLLFVNPVLAGQYNSFQYDYSNSGYMPFNSNSDGSLSWSAKLGGSAWGSTGTVISDDGTLYSVEPNGEIYKITSTGESILYANYDGWGENEIVLAGSRLFFSAYDDRLISQSIIGQENFSMEYEDSSGAFNLYGNKIIISASSDKTVKCIDSSGFPVWVHSFGARVSEYPTIDKEGNVYIGCNDGTYWKLNGTDGSSIWTIALSGNPFQNTAIYNNTLFVPSDTRLYSITSDGSINWYLDIAERFISTVACDEEYIYVSAVDLSWNITLYKLDKQGFIIWSYKMGGVVGANNAGILIDASHNIYFSGNTREFLCFDSDGNIKWNFKKDNLYFRASPIMSEDGSIYLKMSDGYIYCFGSDINKQLGIIDNSINGFFNPLNSFINFTLTPIIKTTELIEDLNIKLEDNLNNATSSMCLITEPVNLTINAFPTKIHTLITYYLMWLLVLIVFKKR